MTDHDESERLVELLGSAARLPRSLEPPIDQWPAIHRRIDEHRVVPLHADVSDEASPKRARNRRSHSAARWWVAAAAVVVILVGVTNAVRTSPVPSQVVSAPAAASSSPTAPTDAPRQPPVRPAGAGRRSAVVVPASSRVESERARVLHAFDAYEDAARELSWSLESRRNQLDPKTLAVLDTCLKAIDKAIREAKAALDRNPGSESLGDFLESSYRQKVDLLKHAVEGPRHTL
jgi:hypothetical protein